MIYQTSTLIGVSCLLPSKDGCTCHDQIIAELS